MLPYRSISRWGGLPRSPAPRSEKEARFYINFGRQWLGELSFFHAISNLRDRQIPAGMLSGSRLIILGAVSAFHFDKA